MIYDCNSKTKDEAVAKALYALEQIEHHGKNNTGHYKHDASEKDLELHNAKVIFERREESQRMLLR